MLPITDIQQYGGKAAILRYMSEKLPTLPIPKFVVKHAGQSLDSVLGEFNSMKKPITVRSSSPYEYADFEGIFTSVQGVYNERSLAAAIQEVESSALSERAKTYAALHKLTIDEKIHTIIQEQSPSQLQGAMMRHPNNPKIIYITCFRNSGRYQQEYFGGAYNENSEHQLNNVTLNEELDLKKVKILIKKYKEIESLHKIGEEVLYVEFGLNPLAIYQARPFKKIQTADFPMPEIDEEYSLSTDVAFGITPPEGIVLPVLRSVGSIEMSTAIQSAEKKWYGQGHPRTCIEYGDHESDWSFDMANLGSFNVADPRKKKLFAKMMKDHHARAEELLQEPYCFLTSSAKREDYDVDVTIPHMQALMVGQAQAFLTHGLMRLIKQAQITLAFGPELVGKRLYTHTKTGEHHLRIISNGKEAVAMRE